MFCDQTSYTVDKVERRTAAAKQRAGPHKKSTPVESAELAIASHGPTSCDHHDIALPPIARSELLWPSADDFALSYCYALHIVPPERYPLTVSDDGLLTCLRALGMASYSTLTPSSKAQAVARQYYIDAIHQTNAALASPAHATQDATLMQVMTLSYFESITGNEATSLQFWAQHVEGTAALLHLRGPQQLARPGGMILFMQTTANLITHCLRSGERLPAYVEAMTEEAAKHIQDLNSPLWRLHAIMTRLTNFHAEAINGHLADPDLVIQQALEIDEELATLFDGAPARWDYQEVTLSPSSDTTVFPKAHLFNDMLSSQCRNATRNGRIFSNLIVLEMLSQVAKLRPLHNKEQQQATQSLAIIAAMQDDILAAVPQHLDPSLTGHSLQCDATNTDQPQVFLSSIPDGSGVMYFERSQLPVLRTARGHLLLWAVALVGRTAAHGSIMRIRACQALRLISKALGIALAALLAEKLEKKDSLYTIPYVPV